MTDELFFSALPLLESLVLVGLLLFVEYTKLEELESYFSENEVVQRNKRFWSKNRHIDKTMRMSVIVCFLFHPARYIKLGDVSHEELAAIPLALKRWVVWPCYWGFFWLFRCTVSLLWDKFH
ncbi:hypothetical protein H097_00365 [Pseudomonas sp. FH4]|jgi:hypothetical protein|uniref:hypothetical protein n=1 Tax=Pseudomonas TaxID=286 RepID=UPI0003DC10DD|nr:MULTISPECIES: hypothetical protein [Pseudomonas]KAA6172157.1 hypothetical protein F3K50_16035 [Pseudomonas marginalis]MDZ4305794.1 hypothetical protein [Pseudomonas sp.]ETK21485.1 hypothetical protein H097_00365 [Pseudomonas sp. FH4]MBF8004788.1 hypothetical protein [Pseudomonas brenneri]WJM91777.1 hypothetical protein QDY63_02310 [Pseudomonas brenneri]